MGADEKWVNQTCPPAFFKLETEKIEKREVYQKLK
jgi:hypothetical protein